MDKNFPYSDIIDLPHHKSANRKHMSLYDRAAQFSPFAALTGYDEVIAETGRLTDDMAELPEDAKAELDRRYMLLTAMIDEGYRPEVTVTYFLPDKYKAGGSYKSFTGQVKRVDSTFKKLIFYSGDKDLTGQSLDIKAIVSLEGGIFDEML